MQANKEISKYIVDIIKLCERYNVKTLYSFGSIQTDRFNSESDVDLIVSFNDIPITEYADNYFDFKFSLQDIFNCSVDLLEEQAVKNPYFLQHINSNKQLIYG